MGQRERERQRGRERLRKITKYERKERGEGWKERYLEREVNDKELGSVEKEGGEREDKRSRKRNA